jgi:hypothetical protein
VLFSRFLGSFDGLLHSLDGFAVGLLSSSDDTLVVLQGPADRKVQRMTKHVGTDTTRLGDEQCTRGVVPDLLLVLLAARVLCGYTQAKYQYMHVLWGR